MKKTVFDSTKAGYTYILILGIITVLSYGYAAGITGRTKKNGETQGCQCHGNSPVKNVNITISGPDTVTPGQTVNFLLSITGGPLVRGGTDIAVSRGVLDIVSGSGLRKSNDELTHEFPKLPSQGSVSFQFTYTAPPAEGTDTIFANGNSVNFDLLPYNDNWNFAANKILAVKNPIGIIGNQTISRSFRLEQNYPNPFNPRTHLRFEISDLRFTRLTIYDITSREIETPVNGELGPGAYEIEWDAANFPSGVYYYKLTSGNYIETRKMVLIK